MHIGFSLPVLHPQYASVQPSGYAVSSVFPLFFPNPQYGFNLSVPQVQYGDLGVLSGFSQTTQNVGYGFVNQIGYSLPVPDYFFGRKIIGFSVIHTPPQFGFVENIGFDFETPLEFGSVENVGFGIEAPIEFGSVENVGYAHPIIDVGFGYKPQGFAVGGVGVGFGKVVESVLSGWNAHVESQVSSGWDAPVFSQIYTVSEYQTPVVSRVLSGFETEIYSAVRVLSGFETEIYSDFITVSGFFTPVKTRFKSGFQSVLGANYRTLSEWNTSFTASELARTVGTWDSPVKSIVSSNWQGQVYSDVRSVSEWNTNFKANEFSQTIGTWGTTAQSIVSSNWQGQVYSDVRSVSEWNTHFKANELARTVGTWGTTVKSVISSAWRANIHSDVQTLSEWNTSFTASELARTVSTWGTTVKSVISSNWRANTHSDVQTLNEWNTHLKAHEFSQTIGAWGTTAQSVISSAWRANTHSDVQTLSEWNTNLKAHAFSQTIGAWGTVLQSNIASDWRANIHSDVQTISEWNTQLKANEFSQTIGAWGTTAQSIVLSGWTANIHSDVQTLSEWNTNLKANAFSQTIGAWGTVLQSNIASDWRANTYSHVRSVSEWGTLVKANEFSRTVSAWGTVLQLNTVSNWRANTYSHVRSVSGWGALIKSNALIRTIGAWETTAQSAVLGNWLANVYSHKPTLSEWQSTIQTSKPMLSGWVTAIFCTDENKVISGWNTSIIGFEPSIDVVLDDNHLINSSGQRIEFDDISVSIDTESFVWSGQVTLIRYADYARLKTGEIIWVMLQGERFLFEVQPKSHNYTSAPEVSLSIRLASPSIRLGREKISGEFMGFAKDICENIAGQPIQWDILNWHIPRGRLLVSGQTRIEVIRNVLWAAGGIIQCTPDGKLIARPLFKNAINRMQPEIILTDTQHILSFSENFPDPTKYYNSVNLTNKQGDEPDHDYTIDYIENEGVIRVYGEPWDNSIRLSHTSPYPIFIGKGVERLIQTCQQVEFKEGSGTVSHPIHSISSVHWHTLSLNPVIFSGKNITTSGNGWGIADVKYTYRAIDFPISFSRKEKQITQVLLLANDKVSQYHAINVQRNGGGYQKGEDIVSPLSDLPALLLRGRIEIDLGENWPMVQLQIRFNKNLKTGDELKVFDRLLGTERDAVIMSISHGYTQSFITQMSVVISP
jgi:hypothetical protein